ncbi:MAG: YlbF family regulator, partial [Ruminococcus sp.]|nr:YlbF family regulator [Ruminococcus sp.]
TDKITLIDTEINRIYDEITESDTFLSYNSAKEELDGLISEINSIIMQSANGGDPMTCQPATACGGSCSSCSGCS